MGRGTPEQPVTRCDPCDLDTQATRGRIGEQDLAERTLTELSAHEPVPQRSQQDQRAANTIALRPQYSRTSRTRLPGRPHRATLSRWAAPPRALEHQLDTKPAAATGNHRTRQRTAIAQPCVQRRRHARQAARRGRVQRGSRRAQGMVWCVVTCCQAMQVRGFDYRSPGRVGLAGRGYCRLWARK